MMSFSNVSGALLLATSNKSEIATGFYTLYGDSCGALAPIGDLYKTQVYELIHFINQEQEIIPKSIVTKKPSAELAHNQCDQDRLPDYDLLDPFLREFIEEKKGPKSLEQLPLGNHTAKEITNLCHTQEYKRRQSPLSLKLSRLSFNVIERRIPLVSKYLF